MMLLWPLLTFSQKAGAEGASGTMATARFEVSSIFLSWFLLVVLGVRSGAGERCAAVESVGHEVHVGEKTTLLLLDAREGDSGLEGCDGLGPDAIGAAHPTDAFGGDAQGGLTGVGAGHRREGRRGEAGVGLGVELAGGGTLGAAAQGPGALDEGDELAQTEEDVLVAGQARGPAALEHLGESVEGQGGDTRAHVALARMERLELAAEVVVVLAPGLEVHLPAVAADGHLHDLRGPLVDARDAHVTLDLLDHVLAGVAVTAQGLDGGLGGRVARLGGEELGDGSLGLEMLVALVEL